MNTPLKFILVGFVCVALSSCSDETDSPNTVPPTDSTLINGRDSLAEANNNDSNTSDKKAWNFNPADQKLIALHDRLSFGNGYERVKELTPGFKGVRAENRSAELANKGYTEGVSETNLFGKKTTCIFHFKDDSLYSYTIVVGIVDVNEAEKKYNEIKSYYTYRYGEAQSPNVEEDNYTKTTSYWSTPKGYLVLTNDLGGGQLKFGLQNNEPR